jgi:hypothetical protein
LEKNSRVITGNVGPFDDSPLFGRGSLLERAAAGNKIFHPETCLVTELADVLSSFPRHDMKATVVLPTQRMAVQLINLLSERVGSFMGVDICNLDAFMRKRASQARKGIADSEQEKLILRMLLGSRRWKHLTPGCESEIQVFLNELWLYDLQDRGIEELQKIVREDIYKSDLVKDYLETKFSELALIAREFFATLARMNLVSTAQGACLLAESMCEQKTIDADKKTFIVGFNSVIQPYKKVLSLLSNDPSVEVWLHDGNDVANTKNPLLDLAALLEPSRTTLVEKKERRFSRESVFVCASLNPYAESRRSVDLAKRYIDAGWAPSQIGFLLANEQVYSPILRTLLAEEGIESNFAVPFAFRDTALGSLLTHVNNLLGGSEKACDLVSFLENEWVALFLRRSRLLSGGAHAVSDVTFQIIRTRVFEGWIDIKKCLESTGQAEAAAVVGVVGDLFSGQPRKQRIDSYLNRVLSIVETLIPTVPHKLQEDMELLRTSMDRIDLGADVLGGELTQAECSRICVEFILNQPTHTKGEMLAGVQVLSIPESRHIPFPIVMVLGCHEGDFPQGLPDDTIVEDFLKRRLGLPGWAALEAMEDVTFHLLLARTHKLHLFYSQPDAMNKRVKSRFIQVLEARGQTRVLPVDKVAGNFEAQGVRPESTDRPESEGKIQPLFGFESSQSATKLDKLLRCPYQYVLAHQKVSEWELAEERPRGKEEGTFLHGIIEAFFTGSWDEKSVLESWPKIESAQHFSKIAEARLAEATAKILKQQGQTTAHLQFFAWPRFVAHLQNLYGDGNWQDIEKGLREHSFQGPIADFIGSQNLSGELRGTIDSVDFVDGFTIITDFKRKGVPDSKELKNGLCSQLLLYAIALAQSGEGSVSFDRFLVGYYSVIDGEWTPVAAGSAAKQHFAARGLVRKNTPLITDLMQALHEKLEWRLKDVEALGRYYADPSLCGHCTYGNICRKEDPVWSEHITGQNRLEKIGKGEASAL